MPRLLQAAQECGQEDDITVLTLTRLAVSLDTGPEPAGAAVPATA